MAANRILIICCIVGIVLGYAVGTFVDSVNLNTALTIGLIGGLAVEYLLDKNGAQTGSGTAKTAAPSSNDSVERAKAALAAARGDAAEKAENAAEEAENVVKDAAADVEDILAKAREAIKKDD